MTETRDHMVGYLRAQLIGPVGGEDETIDEPPTQRYLMGILYPQRMETDAAFGDDLRDDGPGEVGDEVGDDPITLANQYMPSSVGLSALVPTGSAIEVTVKAARYTPEGNRWHRTSIGGTEGEVQVLEPGPAGRLERRPVMDGAAELTVLWRPFSGAHLVTVALVNTAQGQAGVLDHASCLCQVELILRCRGAGFLPYPTVGAAPRDEEEEELAFLYRDFPTFAVGHGCAAVWDEETGPTGSTWVRSEFMPSQVVPQVVFDIPGFDDVRRLAKLSGLEHDDEVVDRLDEFVAAYATWVTERKRDTSIPRGLEGAVERLSARLETAVKRMRDGVELLRRPERGGDAQVRRAFALANEAMLMQMVHSREELGGTQRDLSAAITLPEIDYSAEESVTWRPFQLAFLLLTLASVASPEAAYRDVVDLIWFPTGGGKTEAYLGVVAFQVLLRRMRSGDAGAGTTVITRYTLRLLTTQQFQRAATLTCALELLRRKSTEHEFGTVPISIGIWVGNNTSPGTYADAVELLSKSMAGEVTSGSFQLEACPWCGTEVVPKSVPDDRARWGISVSNTELRMWCPNASCPFNVRLPVSAVDEDLYQNPPTFLIATIDKFARMVWEERAGVFLGVGELPGPDLIIQDELHLISGPLGTVAALYEAAFDLVMSGLGRRPKVIASTATIRRAGSQIRGLFDRDVFLFPPAGMTADDSYFVRFDRALPGRLYVGVMAQSHTPTTANVHTAAALLQAPNEPFISEDHRDPLWTLVVYHNSLRELGKTVTLARDDVPARISIIASAEERARTFDADDDLVELTSNIQSFQIPRNLERLKRRYGEPGCVSIVACTNMISVGVDVPRLGLMLVVGQPKTTSEYIQATSRVGRSVPGLVVTLYSAAKPRDRSHYETFRSYHSTLYRQVEPTSVTPYALPARQRALHAALVILARFRLGLSSNGDAARFELDAPTLSAIADLTARVAVADPREESATASHLDELAREWLDRVASGLRSGGLRYRAPGRQHESLLKFFNESGDGWPTLNSMRNVDVDCLVKVRGER